MSWYFETQADNQAPDRHGPYNSINAALDAKDRTRATLAKLNDGIERRFSPVYEADAAVAEAAADHDQRNDEAAAKWQAEAGAKHTPGPWATSHDAVPDHHTQVTVYSEGSGERVATVFQTEANARLIAAAPELLEACEEIKEWLMYIGSKVTFVHLDAAIAKATG